MILEQIKRGDLVTTTHPESGVFNSWLSGLGIVLDDHTTIIEIYSFNERKVIYLNRIDIKKIS